MTSAATASPAANEFVDRLLALEDDAARRELIERCELTPEGVHDVVLRLAAEVERLRLANPFHAEYACASIEVIAEQAGDSFLRAMGRVCRGDLFLTHGGNAEACLCYDEAAQIFTELGRPIEAARTRIGWICTAARMGRRDEALSASRQARRVLLQHGELVSLAQLEMNVGNIHLDGGHYSTALRCFTGSLALSRSLGKAGRISAARSRFNRGLMLFRLGRYREALSELEQARRLHRSLGQAVSCARADLSIGLIHMDLGHYNRAVRGLSEALTIFRELELSSDAVWATFQMADCYLALGRPDEALAAIIEAEEDLARTDNAGNRLAVATRRIAAHLALGQADIAMAILERAERDYPAGPLSHRAWLATRRSGILLQEGAFAGALGAADGARALTRRAGMRRLGAEALITRGSAMLYLGHAAEAETSARSARRQCRRSGLAPLLYRAWELLGQVAEAQGRPALARHRYQEAVRQLEREQRWVIFDFRDAFAADRGTAYERLAALQLQAGRPADALATAERAKSRALADAITGVLEVRPRGSASTRRLAEELTRARESYAATAARNIREDERIGGRARREAGHELAELEERIVGLRQRLQTAGAEDPYGPVANPELPVVPADTSMLEFFFSGDDILRFLVNRAGIHGELLRGAVPELERLLRAFRLNLDAVQGAGTPQADRLCGQAKGILRRLHDLLLGHLEGLRCYGSLVIVPHGLLHYLPFHSLFDGERFLIERFTICYAPSATLYGLCRARPRRRGKALILAHSDGGRLPFVEEEACAVGRVLHAPVHLEAEATRSLLEIEGRRAAIIHIAAHGSFRADAPLFSSLELADGPLTTADVFSLDLRASLVSLSACETGRSVLGGGDELAGLSRAFLYAGAANLLVSQWRVDDASTTVLMAQFYAELQQGHGPSAALRSAQLAYCSSGMTQNAYRHPFYWAGFQLIGDGQGP